MLPGAQITLNITGNRDCSAPRKSGCKSLFENPVRCRFLHVSALPKDCFGSQTASMKSEVQICTWEGTVVSVSACAAGHGCIVDYGWISRLFVWVAEEGVTYTEYNLASECAFPSANRNCTAAEFTCANNRPPLRRCIPRAWVCDGDADCSDALDEHQNCTRRSCTENEFTCSNGLCIRNTYRFVTTQSSCRNSQNCLL